MKVIESSAFASCKGLTSIVVPDFVTTIQDSAFKNCTNLKELTIGKRVETIEDAAFQYSQIGSLVLPDSVVKMGWAVFGNSAALQSVTLGKGLTAIPSSSFENCISLTDVVLQGQVTSIGSSAFRDCKSLVNINFPESITTIGDNAFRSCSSLQVAKLGNSITKIGDRAFASCASLAKLYMPYFLAEYGWGVVNDCPNVTAYIYDDAAIALQWAKENGVKYQLLGSFKPNAVNRLKASPSGKNKVTLTWDESAGAEGYLVYGIRGSEKYSYIGMTTTGTKFTDAKAKDKEYNFYWVFPYIKNSQGQWWSEELRNTYMQKELFRQFKI